MFFGCCRAWPEATELVDVDRQRRAGSVNGDGERRPGEGGGEREREERRQSREYGVGTCVVMLSIWRR